LQRIDLDALLAYARCPMLYWWRRRARIKAPPTVEALPERAFRQALGRYYAGRVTSVQEGVAGVWRDWLAEWGCPAETMDWLRRYAEIEAALLTPFLDGSIRRNDGTPYQAPRMTRRYKEQARSAGLPKIKRDLEQAMRTIPIEVAGECDPTTAFSDAILMALRYDGPERDPYGNTRVDVPFEISITDGITVLGKADLAVMEDGRVILAEAHDYNRCRPPASAIPRRLPIIALFNASGEGWEGQWIVVYRHIPTGSSVKVNEAEPCDRLLPVITAALRGVQCGVYLPRLAVAERECLSCPYYGLCVTEDGLDVLDDLDATLSGVAERAGTVDVS